MRVCRASRAGAKEFLSTLQGLVVCGGMIAGAGPVSDVWRLNLATLSWEPVPALVTARSNHACCAVRGKLVVLGGFTQEFADPIDPTSSVEMLFPEEGAFVDLPPLSCGGIWGAAAIEVEESDSAAGQVLLLGGADEGYRRVSTVQLVDLATGVCTPGRPNLLASFNVAANCTVAANWLPGGGIVCAGGVNGYLSAEVWPPEQGAADATWSWRALPAMSAQRYGCCGCVMSDGRFAVLGGASGPGLSTS
jgi:hypothetical protein